MADYSNVILQQCPGSIGDTSEYNIDGACFVSGSVASVVCGQIVAVKSVVDGYKEITNQIPGGLAYGVALRSALVLGKNANGRRAYLSGEPISVVSHGRVWVLTNTIQSQPRPGSAVKTSASGIASNAGSEIYGWTYTGGFIKWDETYWLVEVQIKQSSAFLRPAAV